MNTNTKTKAHPFIKVTSLEVTVSEDIVTSLDGKIFLAHEPFFDFAERSIIRDSANREVARGRMTTNNKTSTIAAVCKYATAPFERVPDSVKLIGRGSNIVIANALKEYPHAIFPKDVLKANTLVNVSTALRTMYPLVRFSVVTHPHDSNYGVVFCRESLG